MENTPKNIGRLIAKHQIKFIHGRTFTDLENDVNKRLENNVGKYEIKDITLDLSQTGARLAMIHYYEYVKAGEKKQIVDNYKAVHITKEYVQQPKQVTQPKVKEVFTSVVKQNKENNIIENVNNNIEKYKTEQKQEIKEEIKLEVKENVNQEEIKVNQQQTTNEIVVNEFDKIKPNDILNSNFNPVSNEEQVDDLEILDDE